MSSETHALSGAYAVDAVNDVERAGFERHLAECADCRAEVASLREAAAALAQQCATPAPRALRAVVLTDIARVRPLPPVTPPRSSEPASPVVTTLEDHRTAPQEGGARRWFPALVAAAVLSVLGIGGAVWQPWKSDDQATQSQLTASERVLQAPDAKDVTLGFPDGSTATVIRSEQEQRAVLKTTDMALPPEGSVYEVWWVSEDGSMTSAGLMPEKADQTVLLEGDATQAVAAGISIEPDGGSEQPTTEPIALFDFAEST